MSYYMHAHQFKHMQFAIQHKEEMTTNFENLLFALHVSTYFPSSYIEIYKV